MLSTTNTKSLHATIKPRGQFPIQQDIIPYPLLQIWRA